MTKSLSLSGRQYRTSVGEGEGEGEGEADIVVIDTFTCNILLIDCLLIAY